MSHFPHTYIQSSRYKLELRYGTNDPSQGIYDILVIDTQSAGAGIRDDFISGNIKFNYNFADLISNFTPSQNLINYIDGGITSTNSSWNEITYTYDPNVRDGLFFGHDSGTSTSYLWVHSFTFTNYQNIVTMTLDELE